MPDQIRALDADIGRDNYEYVEVLVQGKRTDRSWFSTRDDAVAWHNEHINDPTNSLGIEVIHLSGGEDEYLDRIARALSRSIPTFVALDANHIVTSIRVGYPTLLSDLLENLPAVPNEPPVILDHSATDANGQHFGPNPLLEMGEVTLSLTAHDPDGDPLTAYFRIGEDTYEAPVGNDGRASITLNFPVEGDHQVFASVGDETLVAPPNGDWWITLADPLDSDLMLVSATTSSGNEFDVIGNWNGGSISVPLANGTVVEGTVDKTWIDDLTGNWGYLFGRVNMSDDAFLLLVDSQRYALWRWDAENPQLWFPRGESGQLVESTEATFSDAMRGVDACDTDPVGDVTGNAKLKDNMQNVRFSFSADREYDDGELELKGKFKYHDKNTGLKLRGDVARLSVCDNSVSVLTGDCTVKGGGDCSFRIIALDAPGEEEGADLFSLEVTGDVRLSLGDTLIGKGEIELELDNDDDD